MNLKRFLLREEKNKQPISQTKPTNFLEKSCNDNGVTNNINSNQNDTDQLSNFGILISNATAKWSDTQTDNTLDNINLSVKPGRLAAIIGPVGAGKVHLL